MKKLIIIPILLLRIHAFTEDIIIAKDTTINNTWNIPAVTILRFETGGHISGKGVVNGGIIEAAYNQDIFDSRLTIRPAAMYNINFSARWFGAQPSNTARQNRIAIQKAIDVCKGTFPLFLPRGIYNLDTSLSIQSFSNGIFSGVGLHFFGESNYWDEGNGSILNFLNRAAAGIRLQQNKGTEINNIIIQGQFTPPSVPVQKYYALTYAQYTDPTCGQLYFGIEIDYAPNPDGSVSGSSGLYIHDLIIRKFTVNIACSIESHTLNADALTFERIYFGDCKVCYLSTQGQEKGNIMRNIYCWSSHYCFFRSGLDGLSPGAGGYTIDGGNITGGVQEFMINASAWQPTNVSNMFFESLASIGNITTDEQLKFTSCTFDFRPNAEIGARPLLTTNETSNPGGVVFDNCLFRFFGTGGKMQFVGQANFMNCYWYGTYTNKNPRGRYQMVMPSDTKTPVGN